VEHGTASTYNNWSCRCQPCSTAQFDRHRVYQRVWRRTVRLPIADPEA
jgi:hypothetical protein